MTTTASRIDSPTAWFERRDYEDVFAPDVEMVKMTISDPLVPLSMFFGVDPSSSARSTGPVTRTVSRKFGFSAVPLVPFIDEAGSVEEAQVGLVSISDPFDLVGWPP